MKNVVVIGGTNRHHKIMDVIRKLSQEEMRKLDAVDVSEIKDIPFITTSDFNIINGRGYSKQMRKPNSKNII
jgi:hypothetical protein